MLLVHDLLLSKKGIAAPTSHPLRAIVTKHKARLTAELTKTRLKRGFSNLADLKVYVDHGKSSPERSTKDQGAIDAVEAYSSGQWPHPRWVRVNTLRTSLEEQMDTTFSSYQQLDTIKELLVKTKETEKFLHIDKHVPNLIALSRSENLTHTAAYRNGLIIFQDKASCCPSYLLGPPAGDRDCIDACAAPGNKTTHVAALMHGCEGETGSRIYACERDKQRAKTLESMITLAGAKDLVVIKAGQDFLRIDPTHANWGNVGSILLDPSCSGSGIVGRDENLLVVLPKVEDVTQVTSSKKRKRKPSTIEGTDKSKRKSDQPEEPLKTEDENPILDDALGASSSRLEALSYIQLKLLLHAFRFPHATRITYSTCSTHSQENEYVVVKALLSNIAIERGWRILRRDEQVSGMAAWHIRGQQSACEEAQSAHKGSKISVSAEEVATACIRCEKGTKEGTQGFFVAAFVRSESDTAVPGKAVPSAELVSEVSEDSETYRSDEKEWEGFSDGG